MAVRFQLRRDTAANWISTNPVLALGEPGVETNTLKVKVGDGATAWNSLGYSITKDFTDLISKPTTIAGYGITDGLTLAGLSVIVAGAGVPNLSYNNITGVFTYTPPEAVTLVTPAFHGFVVNANGDLEYTKMTSGDFAIADGNNTEQYVMWEIGTSDYNWKINDNGVLQIEYTDSDV